MGRRAAIAVAVIVLILAVPPVYFVVTRFVIHQAAVTTIAQHAVSSMPELSPAARDVFQKVQGQQIPWLVTVGLLSDIAPEHVRMGEWHARGAIWEHLLPLRLSDEELLALYTYYMLFEDGGGIEFGSRKYFGKAPSDLTVEDAIGIVVISSNPRSHSPRSNAEHYREAHERLMAKYRSAG